MISELAAQELTVRQQLEQRILDIIMTRYQYGNGWSPRGEVQQFVYAELGFKGNSGNNFARFINKILLEQGVRLGWSCRHRAYYGLICKANISDTTSQNQIVASV